MSLHEQRGARRTDERTERFVLNDGDQQFSSNFENREKAEQKARAVGGRVLFFGVKVTDYDSVSKRVTNWEKVKGRYSVWIRNHRPQSRF